MQASQTLFYLLHLECMRVLAPFYAIAACIYTVARVSFRNFHKGGANWISKYLGGGATILCVKEYCVFSIMVMYRFEFLGHPW